MTSSVIIMPTYVYVYMCVHANSALLTSQYEPGSSFSIIQAKRSFCYNSGVEIDFEA